MVRCVALGTGQAFWLGERALKHITASGLRMYATEMDILISSLDRRNILYRIEQCIVEEDEPFDRE